MSNEIAKGRLYATNAFIECQKELEQYRAIGTVEECRVAVERQKKLPKANTGTGIKAYVC